MKINEMKLADNTNERQKALGTGFRRKKERSKHETHKML